MERRNILHDSQSKYEQLIADLLKEQPKQKGKEEQKKTKRKRSNQKDVVFKKQQLFFPILRDLPESLVRKNDLNNNNNLAKNNNNNLAKNKTPLFDKKNRNLFIFVDDDNNEYILEIRKQTEFPLTYRPEVQACQCWLCSISTSVAECKQTDGVQDPKIGLETCCGGFCPSRAICGKPDLNACTVGQRYRPGNPIRADYVNWDKEHKAPYVQCWYNIDSFKTIDDINIFYQETENKKNRDILMCKLCAQNWDGQCDIWYDKFPEKEGYSLFLCEQNPTFRKCKCIRRATDDPNYIRWKSHTPFPDGCWYVPCNDETQFIPENIKKQNSNCPLNVCEILIDAQAKGNIDLDNNIISCNWNPPPPPPPSPPSPPSPPPNHPPIPSPSIPIPSPSIPAPDPTPTPTPIPSPFNPTPLNPDFPDEVPKFLIVKSLLFGSLLMGGLAVVANQLKKT